MQERDFWIGLEFCLCGELTGMPEKWQRRYWCDGFIPESYDLQGRPPQTGGRVWMVYGQEQQKWTFRLLLPRRYDSVDDIDWESLLPPANVTRWLAIDPHRRYVEIEPSVAVPDLPEN